VIADVELLTSDIFIFQDIQIIQVAMPTLLIKNVPHDLMRELKKLKVELGCRTWAELLEKLVKLKSREIVLIEDKDLENMKRAVDEFLKLRDDVSRRWAQGGVLEEFRRARGHEAEDTDTRR